MNNLRLLVQMKRLYTQWILFFTFIFMTALPLSSYGEPSKPIPKPGAKETCPVCGMFVSLYPDWVASVHYTDGFTHYFDGVKDLFKYLNNMKKWAQNRKKQDISAIWVTEYYSLGPVDGKKAFYVAGSDVLGPMGHELIPFFTMDDAKNFLIDHKGKKIITFSEVTDQIIMDIDKGIFKFHKENK